MANNYVITEGGELRHYGVIGMRWGIRKAKLMGKSYTYKSHAQKKYEKKLGKAKEQGASEKRINKLTNKHEHYKTRDARRQDYAERTRFGKSVAKGLLMGPFGSGHYNRMRAAGASRIPAFMASNWAASTLAFPVTYLLSRGVETNAARTENNERRRTEDYLKRRGYAK